MLSTRIPRSWLDGSGTTRQVTSRPVKGSWPSTCQFVPCRVTWLCQLDRSVCSSADTFGRTAPMHAATAFSKSSTLWSAQPAVAQAVTVRIAAAVPAASRRRCTTWRASHRRTRLAVRVAQPGRAIQSVPPSRCSSHDQTRQRRWRVAKNAAQLIWPVRRSGRPPESGTYRQQPSRLRSTPKATAYRSTTRRR